MTLRLARGSTLVHDAAAKMIGFNRRTVDTVVALARRRVRWLFQPPRVAGSIPPMFPGGLRAGDEEEEAAVAAVRAVMRARKLFRFGGPGGPLQPSRVRELELAFAERLAARHTLAVNSGTSALVCGLAALGIGPGDEVIVPAFTWVSTASAAVAVGAVPVIAEVDDSLTLDVADVERRLSAHTRAIIAVHMRGAPARLDALTELARGRGLRLVEDVAQAAGGSFRGRRLGSIGDVGAFSFQMSKILTAGEGGLVATEDAAIHQRAAMYHDSAVCPQMGVSTDAWIAGLNLRMSELHAAVLLVQLLRLDVLLADMRVRKARLMELIRSRLAGHGVVFRTLNDAAGDTAIALIFFLPDSRRVAAFVTALADDGVPASRLYHDLAYLPHDHIDLHAYSAWTAILRKRAWSDADEPWRSHPRQVPYSAEMCPGTLDLLRRAVHIDVSPDLSPTQVEQIGGAIVVAAERLL